MVKSVTQMSGNAGEDVEQVKHFTAGRANLYTHCGHIAYSWELMYAKIQLSNSCAYTQRMLHSTTGTCSDVFIGALFIIVRNRKQLAWPSTG